VSQTAGFAVQLTTAHYLGVFLEDQTDVPAEVVDYLAEQLGNADAVLRERPAAGLCALTI